MKVYIVKRDKHCKYCCGLDLFLSLSAMKLDQDQQKNIYRWTTFHVEFICAWLTSLLCRQRTFTSDGAPQRGAIRLWLPPHLHTGVANDQTVCESITVTIFSPSYTPGSDAVMSSVCRVRCICPQVAESQPPVFTAALSAI